MKLYVYCVTRGLEALPYVLHGIDGAEVSLYRSGDLCLLVSPFAADTVLINRHNALAHSSVVQAILNQTTPLPFRCGTLVGENQLESYLNARREKLRAQLKLVRNCVEMSVKIISPADGADGSLAKTVKQHKPGTTFLSEKRREILGDAVRTEEAKRLAEWLEGQLSDVVRKVDIKTNATRRLSVAAAHLVERSRVDEFRTKATAARQQRPELHFLVSGPWAPYSFANIDLEFKTQFGVS